MTLYKFGPDIEMSKTEEKELRKMYIDAGMFSDIQLTANRFFKLLPRKLSSDKKKRAWQIAKTGERYTGHCIELWLWGKGYALNGLEGNSFTIEPQYYQANHRVDFRVVITTTTLEKPYISKSIILIIDSKNWARYTTKETTTYMKEHIKPFKSFIANKKIMFMNYRLIPMVFKMIQAEGILPVEVLEHLTTPDYLTHYLTIEMSMIRSIQCLDKLIPIPDLGQSYRQYTTPQAIRYDIELGKPYRLIAERWEISQGYIDKLKNQMVKAGVVIPDRKDEVFSRLCQYNDYFRKR